MLYPARLGLFLFLFRSAGGDVRSPLDETHVPCSPSIPSTRFPLYRSSAQFFALVKKNFTLKTRGILCCCTGVEIILPVFFLAVLCLPKALVEDSVNNDVVTKPYHIATPWGATEFTGGGGSYCVDGYKILVAPASAEATRIATKTAINLICSGPRSEYVDSWAGNFVKSIGCQTWQGMGVPSESMMFHDPDLAALIWNGTGSSTFATVNDQEFQIYHGAAANSTETMRTLCSDTCLRDTAGCYKNAWGDHFIPKMVKTFATKAEGLAWIDANPGPTLAMVSFDAGVEGSADADATRVSYSLHTNTTAYDGDQCTDSDSGNCAFRTTEYFGNQWESESDNPSWRGWGVFSRIQNAIDAALIDEKDGDGVDYGVTLDASVKPFPWLGYDYNLGGIIAAGVFSILGALAFMSNVVIIMKSVVVEKELRLREGMQMMGMSSNMYWASWFYTHLLTAMCTVVLIVLIGMYPFEYTNPFLQLVFYTLWITSCILWNYMISTVFSRSITASVVGCFVYVMSIAPAIAVRIVEPQGSAGWLATCLLPGSSINMWGHILARLELAKEGITFETAGTNLNKYGEFSAASVIGMVFLDCVIFAIMTWYLDKVWPTEFGQKLSPFFPFTKEYWFGEPATVDDSSAAGIKDESEYGENFEPLSTDQLKHASVKIRGLKKQFGNGVVAVDDLTVTFIPGQVSALLGHNGAGKTTTISMLTGTLNASGGDAMVNGKSIRTEMEHIRESLGICPQFDVLWPMLTVREHLRLYAAFGGMDKKLINDEIVSAVNEVALSEKLNYKTGLLSGGQKRKLSLAISFIGKPSVVFLDEPTSGMDPYSRRFTWEVIRKRAATSSIMLTTHFLDEADLLCDRIAIMSAGKLACVGSPVFLKNRYGAGYHLTLARKSASASQGKISGGDADGVLQLVRRYVGSNAMLASDVGAELSFTLPFESTAKFPELFKELDGKLDGLGFQSYGISCTTLEEVFLSIARGGVGGNMESRKSLDVAGPVSDVKDTKPLMDDPDEDLDAAGNAIRAGYVTGWALVARQCRGLLWKRWLNWQRDWKSILVQLAFPVMFFILALVLAGLEFEDSKDFRNVDVTRKMLGNRPTIASVRSTDVEANAVLAQWPTDTVTSVAYKPMIDCACNCPAKGQIAVFDTAACCMHDLDAAIAGAAAAGLAADQTLGYCAAASQSGFGSGGSTCEVTTGGDDTYGGMDVEAACKTSGGGTFDAYLWSVTEERTTCDRQSTIGCDALHIEGYDASTGKYLHTMYAHQSAYHSVPATVNEANSAILKKRTGGSYSGINVVSEWLPVVEFYQKGEVVDDANDTTFITSLFIVMGASILTASIVVFPVHERRNNSKHLQMVSGINKVAYWFCHWIADAAQMIVPIAAIMAIFAAFNIEQYRGQLDAVFVLTLCFIACSITYTHLVGFYYKNEFYAFVGLTGAKLFLSVISVATGMVLELLKDLNDDTKKANAALSIILPILIPHYSYGKGLYDIGQNKLNENRRRFDTATMSLAPVGTKDWWHEDVIGDDIAWLCGLCVGFGVLVLLVELSEGSIATLASKGLEFARIKSRETGSGADTASLNDEADDEDVAEERKRVEDMAAAGFSADRREENAADHRDGVILHGITKTFGFGGGAKKAVRNLSVGMPRGQCFGLLGINGAGKTSTFKMITGEFAPTRGDTRVLVTGDGKREYLSVHTDLSRARTVMGYCPQFDGLQPNLTGREHLQFYAQVRGVPDDLIADTVDSLLQKMSLVKYAERQAGTYSGGNKRKLSVAIALIGEPAVVLLDEPSTGMDPEARRFMWDVISASTKGRTIVLTSHSMEECEALCNRIGIMVGGQFKCLGSLQHLKNRFSEGYTVDVRFQSGLTRIVYDAIVQKGIHAQVMESHDTELKLRVDDSGATKLWQIFAAIEEVRAMPKPPQTVVHVDGEDPVPAAAASNEGGLVDDYSVSQTTLEQVFVRFASTQNEETQHAPGMTEGGFDQQQQQPAAFPPQSPPQMVVAPAPAPGEFHQFAPTEGTVGTETTAANVVPPGYVQRP